MEKQTKELDSFLSFNMASVIPKFHYLKIKLCLKLIQSVIAIVSCLINAHFFQQHCILRYSVVEIAPKVKATLHNISLLKINFTEQVRLFLDLGAGHHHLISMEILLIYVDCKQPNMRFKQIRFSYKLVILFTQQKLYCRVKAQQLQYV